MRSSSDESALAWSLLSFFFYFFPFFFLGMLSSRDFMLLTTCVALLNSAVLAHLLLLEQASFSFNGRYALWLLNYSLSTLHSSKEFPGPYNMHVFFAPVNTSLRWLASFSLLFPAQPFLGLYGEADPPPFCFLQELARSALGRWVCLKDAPTY